MLDDLRRAQELPGSDRGEDFWWVVGPIAQAARVAAGGCGAEQGSAEIVASAWQFGTR